MTLNLSKGTTSYQIRSAKTGEGADSDWKEIRRICCETGNSGAPIDGERWRFFGEFWVGPYQALMPEWTWVVDAGGRVAGYLTGCPDTAHFLAKKRWLFTSRLLFKACLNSYRWNPDVIRFLKRSFWLERTPEEVFPKEVIRSCYQEFPAHLHINLDASLRGSGVGRSLMEWYCERLKANGIPGVHLFCGKAPLAFYFRCGFTELSRIEYRPGVWVYALGKKI